MILKPVGNLIFSCVVFASTIALIWVNRSLPYFYQVCIGSLGVLFILHLMFQGEKFNLMCRVLILILAVSVMYFISVDDSLGPLHASPFIFSVGALFLKYDLGEEKQNP